jgi:DNA-binding NtrC family response regulator
VVRTGDSLFLLSADLRPFRKAGVQQEGDRIIGPLLREVLVQASRASKLGKTLHITGETGSGKEGVARAFHGESLSGRGPFVAINCATIAPGVAERVLFGARRGAFSGAVTDTEGLVQSADGGTLFLDEIAELDFAVQAKLLRVLETGEVLPIGGLKPRQVDIQLCSASHRDLRTETSAGRFREDLYYRINSPEAVVPPLRRRIEEMPWLIEQALRPITPRLPVHGTFVEACLLRPWPGNVRELMSEVRAAAQNATGREAARLEPVHLNPRAGQPLERPVQPQVGCAMLWHPPVPAVKPPPRELPDRARIEEALRQSGGNISAAARLLGLHRTQLKRLFEKLGIGHERGEQTLEEEGD